MKKPTRYRLNLTYEPVRKLLSEFKEGRGIPENVGLSDSERGEFEVFAITEGRKRNIDVFGNSEYLNEIIKSNIRMTKRKEQRL